MDGITELGNVLIDIPKDLKKCSKIKNDVKKLEKKLEIFKHPVELMKTLAANIADNIIEINHDIIKSLKAFDKGDYYKFGKWAGEALVIAIGPVNFYNLYQSY